MQGDPDNFKFTMPKGKLCLKIIIDFYSVARMLSSFHRRLYLLPVNIVITSAVSDRIWFGGKVGRTGMEQLNGQVNGRIVSTGKNGLVGR